MKSKTPTQVSKTPHENGRSVSEKKNPLFRAAKHILQLLQNKVIASLMMFGQGILFIVSPSGDMEPTVRISAGVVLAFCVFMMVYHLVRKEKKGLDILIAVISFVFAGAAVYCMISPQTVKPYVKTVVGYVTVATGLVNLVQTLKIEKKKDWKFVVSVLGAVAITALGIVMIIAEESDVAAMQQSIGAILMLNALANIWYIIQLHRTSHSAPAPNTYRSSRSKAS